MLFPALFQARTLKFHHVALQRLLGGPVVCVRVGLLATSVPAMLVPTAAALGGGFVQQQAVMFLATGAFLF